MDKYGNVSKTVNVDGTGDDFEVDKNIDATWVTFAINGTFTNLNITFSASIDGVNFAPLEASSVGAVATKLTAGATGVISAAATYQAMIPAGTEKFKVDVTAIGTGSADVTVAQARR